VTHMIVLAVTFSWWSQGGREAFFVLSRARALSVPFEGVHAYPHGQRRETKSKPPDSLGAGKGPH